MKTPLLTQIETQEIGQKVQKLINELLNKNMLTTISFGLQFSLPDVCDWLDFTENIMLLQ